MKIQLPPKKKIEIGGVGGGPPRPSAPGGKSFKGKKKKFVFLNISNFSQFFGVKQNKKGSPPPNKKRPHKVKAI